MNIAYGVGLSLATAFLWAVSPVCFAGAGRRIGSFPVAVIRAVFAALLLLAVLPLRILAARHGLPPLSTRQALLIAWSGVAGMGLGDVACYEAFLLIGVLQTTLILTLAPVAAALTAWLLIGEVMTGRMMLGTVIVLIAAAIAALARETPDRAEKPRSLRLGLILAIAGSFFVGVGATAARQAFRAGAPIDAYAATTIRVGAAALFLVLLSRFRRSAMPAVGQVLQRPVWTRIGIGTIAGPFVGMLCYVSALGRAPAGLVSALSSMSPLFVLPIVAVQRRTAPTAAMVIASVIAAAGVTLIMAP